MGLHLQVNRHRRNQSEVEGSGKRKGKRSGLDSSSSRTRMLPGPDAGERDVLGVYGRRLGSPDMPSDDNDGSDSDGGRGEGKGWGIDGC